MWYDCQLGDNCIVFEAPTASIGNCWSQIKFTGDALAETVNGFLRPSNPQLMPLELKIQYCYLHSNETDRKQR